MCVRVVIALCLALLLPTPLAAGTFQAQWENDIWAGTDKHYTNAVRLVWLSNDLKSYADDSRLPQGFRNWLSSLPYINRPDKKFNVGLAIGQDMFTPDDITVKDPPEGDHPYAGWLYGSLILNQKDDEWLDTVVLSLGMVGPSSQAEFTQTEVHKLIDSPRPQGWNTQLRDEFGAMLTYLGTWRAYETTFAGRFGLDFMPHVGATVGNVHTYANTGLEVRLGWNLPKNFGTTLISPAGGVTADTTPDADNHKTPPFSLYTFLYMDGRAVARNIFLDGNTFRQSRRVPKNALVADVALGVGLQIYDVFVSISQCYRTPEFAGQGKGQRYGSLNLGIVF